MLDTTGRHGVQPHRLVVVTVVLAGLALVASACGDTSDSGDGTAAPDATTSIEESGSTGSEQDSATTSVVEFFDDTVVHDVAVTFDQDAYDAMVEEYVASGSKEWIEATVTLDGSSYEQVGMRLKGNSSLFGLSDDSGGFGGFGGFGDIPEECLPEGFGEGGFPGVGAGPGGPGGDASADEPEGLPWLIRLDKFVDDQNHGGLFYVVIRSNSSQTSLNEAVALDLLEAADLASEAAVATRFSVNGSDPQLRLAIENPDDVWMQETFGAGGALYKAQFGGDYSYRGDDPDAYNDVFEQKAGKDNVDLTPLMGFLDFINSSDDATFNAELRERLDVDAFATYLAMQDLIGNFDDIDGPGNNSYLYYDTTTTMFTVVAWDMNLAFSALGDAGGGGFAGAVGFPGGGFELPEGCEFPGRGAGGPDGPGGAGGFLGSNILVERFLTNPEFEALYQSQVESLTASLYGSGVGDDLLSQRVDVLEAEAADLVDSTTITEEADGISSQFEAVP